MNKSVLSKILKISCQIYFGLKMPSNGEIIHVHVGQAGVQIANACWELYCLEHGIDQYGCLYDYSMNDSFQTFFAYSNTSKLVPRLVMVDSEPTVIDEVRTGAYGTLFKPHTLINGKEDSGSNFARGYNTIGAELIDLTMDSLRDVAEGCPNLKGFLVFRSVGGGTGSGLGNRIMEEISNDYGKMTKMDFIIFPSPSITPLIVEPYNSLLATHIGMDSSDCTFILDNEALYDICETKLGVFSPTYTNLNRIIAQAISTLTTSQRFFGSLNVSFTEFQTNLVPFPRIHFPLVSYSPLVAMDDALYTEFDTEHMTFDCFQPSSQFIRCNPKKGKYMSCVLLYRGNVTSSDINSSIRNMKSRGSLNFVDWSPTGFKVGINSMPPCSVYGGDIGPTDRAMMALSNNTAIQMAWCRMLSKYMQLYNRRAFVHHFVSEGLEESTFMEASEDICTLISDYREVEGLSGTASSSRRSKAATNEDALISDYGKVERLSGTASSSRRSKAATNEGPLTSDYGKVDQLSGTDALSSGRSKAATNEDPLISDYGKVERFSGTASSSRRSKAATNKDPLISDYGKVERLSGTASSSRRSKAATNEGSLISDYEKVERLSDTDALSSVHSIVATDKSPLISDNQEVEESSETACSSGRFNAATNDGPSWQQRFKLNDDEIQLNKGYNACEHIKYLQKGMTNDFKTKVQSNAISEA